MERIKFLFGKIKRGVVAIAIVLFTISGLGMADNYFEISKNLDIFATLFKELNIYYVDEIKTGDIIKKGLDAMLESLDPYTEYVPESDLEDYKMKYVSSQYGGIGALIHERNGEIVVSEPFQNFPAQKAGLMAGDILIEVDGIPMKGKNSDMVSELLKGQTGTPIKMQIRRPGVEGIMEKTILREEIKINNVSYYGMINDSIGYIKLDKFLTNCYKEVKDALVELKKKPKLKSVVFDLRGNGGGILQESVNIVNLFVNKGQDVVSQKGKIKEMNRSYKALNDPVDANIPLVVLVDGGSASASEIVTGAIQELDRGVIIGAHRTYGKGLVQQTLNLSYNSLLKVTVAKYYTPSGRCIQALDYTHRNEDGSVFKVPDSLITEFKTKNNRSVYDGSGIYPDILTPARKYSNISYALVSKFLIFDFATQYRIAHPEIASARDFAMTDKDYADFLEYIKGKDYTYVTKSEKTLEDLETAAKKEKYYDDVKEEYKALRNKMELNKKDDLTKFKKEIKEIIESEIVTRYYFQDGRVEANFSKDEDVKEAVRVLNDKELYASILKGVGEYKVIGKPKKNSTTASADVEEED